MAPKKKGKATKFSRMTDEERARYLQHRAAIEEEARRRKQELVFTFLKSKFKREDAFARINLAKIHQQWRQILRNIKIVELKEEVEALQQSFNRLFETKDEAVRSLVEGLDEAEAQYRRNLYSHVCTIDRLIVLQSERLRFLHKDYVNKKNLLLKDGRKRLQECKVSNFMAQEHLSVIIHASETKFLKSESEARNEFITKTTEWKNMYDNEHNLMMGCREDKIEVLTKIFNDTTNEYLNSTEERRKHYATLKAKDDLNRCIIEKQSKRLEDGQVLTEKLKEHLASLRVSYDISMNNMKEERNELSAYFSQLRNNSLLMEKIDKEKITHVAVASNNVINYLEKLIDQANNILRLAQSCRRFETIQEKVVKPGFSDDKPENHQLSACDSEDEETSNWLKCILADYKELDGFWKRFNKVLMERATLKLHYSALSVENDQLKAALRHYFSSISPSSQMIREGPSVSSAKTLNKEKERKYIMETSSKKIIPREKFYQNPPRPVTSVEGCIAIRNYSLT
ncbi:dynein regulatory complex subunit 2 [Ischnura elegans]|uniref:dynein regulatory complex subunit 2 n=1 Tax=Ischnura elegans TaxID=197161 RepID=UPI001ED8A88B|nr:dynein regulatory complex subunit 2 [Ischnura elegans]